MSVEPRLRRWHLRQESHGSGDLHLMTNVGSRTPVLASDLHLSIEPTWKVDLMNKQTRWCPDVRSIRRSTAANESARVTAPIARCERVVASATKRDNT
jgi:hypothetical protein